MSEEGGGVYDYPEAQPIVREEATGERQYGKVIHLKNGYGFVMPDGGTEGIFFFWPDIQNCDFNDLELGDRLEYEVGRNDRGLCAKNIVRLDADLPDE